MNDRHKEIANMQSAENNRNPSANDIQKWFKEQRGSIMVVAVLVASVTYAAGLSPPGGFWDANGRHGLTAGDPILRDIHPHRYVAFFYGNATAFMSSLVIIILLVNNVGYDTMPKIKVLAFTMVLDLLSMMFAFTAGSTRSMTSSFYVIALAVVAILFVLMQLHLLSFDKFPLQQRNSAGDGDGAGDGSGDGERGQN